MIIWIDAQLSPALAPWMAEHFGVAAYSVKFLGYRDAADHEIFRAARDAGAVVMTKDSDSCDGWSNMAIRRRCCGSLSATRRMPV